MSFNYLRKYKLTVENPVKEPDEALVKLSQESSVLKLDADLTRTTVYGTVIEDLHLEASIVFDTTTTSSNGNDAEIKVFNMDKNTRDRISKLNGRVILEAGYENGAFDVIFTGQVKDIYTIRNGTDLVTVISCKDGWTPVSHIRITKSYPKDTNVKDIFEDLISSFEDHGISRSDTGILLDQINPPWAVPSDVKLQKTWAFSGFLRGAMDKLCQEYGLTYQIEHSTLFIYPKTYKKMFTEVTITEEQILSIRRAARSNNKTANDVPKSSGIQVKTLLIPKITPKYRVKVVSNNNFKAGEFSLKDFEGEYKITKVSHNLAYEGSSWYTTLECEAIDE